MANSVPGQVAAGPIDGYLRDDAGNGTLGLPDYSLVPYTYAPLLGPDDATPQWVIDRYRSTQTAAFKGDPDGFGALRDTGGAAGAASISVIPQDSGTISVSPDGSRSPDYTWGPRDFAIAVRHPGATTWSASSIRSYIAFSLDEAASFVGMRLTNSTSLGPWDAEKADSAAISLNGLVNLWDGKDHTFHVSTFGTNVFCLIDGVLGIPFRAPRAYRRKPDGSTDTTVFGSLPATGSFAGFDARGTSTYLTRWDALQAASGDFFLYDMGALSVQAPPATTYTPTTTPSGETWSLTGTATASKNGLQISTSGSATFNVNWPYGVLCTRWTGATGALVFRYVDANNYYQLSSAGIYRMVGGTLTRFHVFSKAPAAGDHIAIRNWADRIRVYINGVSVAYYTASYHKDAKGIGFRSSSAGATQWSYIAFQPLVSDPVLPTV